jgi:glycosyltransferase involved in cell wall biosynthesis
LNDSLSIIVPVRNAEATLAGQIERLLDLLPDLTGRFEIVVVDDGSTDHTVDLVRDFARAYPQVRLIRHAEPRGAEAAVKTGLQSAPGPTVFVQQSDSRTSAAELRRVWSLRHQPENPHARAAGFAGVIEPRLLERLSTWGEGLRNTGREPGCGVLRGASRPLDEDLASKKISDNQNTVNETHAIGHERADTPHALPSSFPRRHAASFLRHLRDLALGE